MPNDTHIRRTNIEATLVSFSFRVAVGTAVVFFFCFLYGAVANTSSATIELERRINPNYAPLESLARLPGIGLVRAQAIVTYREQFHQSGGADLAFHDCNDLQKVKGIGRAVAAGMCQYLEFDGE
jgi:competence ComEA-like helix-hairpin-helix protein